MLLLRTEKLPEGAKWHYEIKYDGYRCQTRRLAKYQQRA